uniref:Uncharacterized protein n=2 Tax=Ditylum brightwellii TaxID=49249 RepID=A0A6V2GMD6_9STRA
MEGRFMEAGEATGNTKSDIAHNDVSKRKSRKSKKRKSSKHRHRNHASSNSNSRYDTPREEAPPLRNNKPSLDFLPPSGSAYNHHRSTPAKTPRPPPSTSKKQTILYEEARDDVEEGRSSTRRKRWWGGSNGSNFNFPRSRCETNETRYSDARDTIISEDVTSGNITYQKKQPVQQPSPRTSSRYYDATDEIYRSYAKSSFSRNSSSSNNKQHTIAYQQNMVDDYVSPMVEDHHHVPWSEQQFPTPPQLQNTHWRLKRSSHDNHQGNLRLPPSVNEKLNTNLNRDMDREDYCGGAMDEYAGAPYPQSPLSTTQHHDRSLLVLSTPATPAESIWHHVRKIFSGAFAFCDPDDELKSKDGYNNYDDYDDDGYHHKSSSNGTSRTYERTSSGLTNNQLVGPELLPSYSQDKMLEYSDLEDDGSSVFFGGDDRTKYTYGNDDNSTLCSNCSRDDLPVGCSPRPSSTFSSKESNTVEIAFMDETNGAIDPHFFRASILRDPALLMGCRYSGWDGKRSHYTATIPSSSFSSPPKNIGAGAGGGGAVVPSNKQQFPFKTPDSTGSSFDDNDESGSILPRRAGSGTFRILTDGERSWISPEHEGELGDATTVIHVIPSPSVHSSPTKQQSQSKTTINVSSTLGQQLQLSPKRTHRKQRSSISEMTSHTTTLDNNGNHLIHHTNGTAQDTTSCCNDTVSRSPVSIYLPPDEISPSQKEMMKDFLSSSSSDDDNDEASPETAPEVLSEPQLALSPVRNNTQSGGEAAAGTGMTFSPTRGLGRPPLIKNRLETIGTQRTVPQPNRARANTGNTTSSRSSMGMLSSATNGSYHRRTDSTVYFSPDTLSLICGNDNDNNRNAKNNLTLGAGVGNNKNKKLNGETKRSTSPDEPPMAVIRTCNKASNNSSSSPYHRRKVSHSSISQTITVVKLNRDEEVDISPIDDDLERNATDDELSPFMKAKQRKGYVVKRDDGVECTPIRRSNDVSSRCDSNDKDSCDKKSEKEEESGRSHFFPPPNQKNGVSVKLFGAGIHGGDVMEEEKKTDEADEKRNINAEDVYGQQQLSTPRDKKGTKKKKERGSPLLSKSSKRKSDNKIFISPSKQPELDYGHEEYFLPKCPAFVKELRKSGRTGNCVLEGWVAFSKGEKLIELLRQKKQDSDDAWNSYPELGRNDFRYATVLDDGPYLHLFSSRKKSKSNDSGEMGKSNDSTGVNSKVMSIDLSQNISPETRLISKKHGRCIVLVDKISKRVICTLLPVSLDPSFFRDKNRSRLVSDKKFENIRHRIFLTPPPAAHGDYRSRMESHVIHHSQRKNKKSNGGGEWGDPNFVEECFAPVAQLESVTYVLFAIDGAMKFKCSLVWN